MDTVHFIQQTIDIKELIRYTINIERLVKCKTNSKLFWGKFAMKEKSRAALWDNAKFFLMILVVIGHATIWGTESSHIFSSSLLFIYSFHMPLFIFISGMFFSPKKIPQKCVSYFAIYCAYKIFIFIVYSLLGRMRGLQLFVEGEAPWFIFALAVYILITYCIRNLNLKYILVIFTILALFAGYDRTLTDEFVLARCIKFYPFYLLGVIVSREKIEKQAQNKYCKFAGLIILIIAALCFWFFKDKLYFLRYIFTGRNAFKTEIWNYGWAMQLLCYAIALIMGWAFIMIMPTKPHKFITVGGQNTLQVYFWHRPLIQIPVDLGILAKYVLYDRKTILIWLFLMIPYALILYLKPFSFPVCFLTPDRFIKKEKVIETDDLKENRN